MFRAITALLTALPLIMTPAMVAQGMNDADGIGFAGALFAIAVALILTLLLRRSAFRLFNAAADMLGEYRLQRMLLDNSDFLMSDFIIPGAYGGLSKIDHALLTRTGLICIRAAHQHGKVFGSADDAQWCHVNGGRRRRFLNPVIQNEGRVRGLSSALPSVPVTNLVVFTGPAQLISETKPNVILLSELSAWIDKHTKASDPVDDLGGAWQRLRDVAITDEDTRKDYQAQIGFC
ncbi:MAG: nuclease-related domain-containing protein [Woeseiaceae bacterium]|nr:nuclease-related domain-containing protein [Woeseiaceae bacterium]